eukprot:Opistho-2@20694
MCVLTMPLFDFSRPSCTSIQLQSRGSTTRTSYPTALSASLPSSLTPSVTSAIMSWMHENFLRTYERATDGITKLSLIMAVSQPRLPFFVVCGETVAQEASLYFSCNSCSLHCASTDTSSSSRRRSLSVPAIHKTKDPRERISRTSTGWKARYSIARSSTTAANIYPRRLPTVAATDISVARRRGQPSRADDEVSSETQDGRVPTSDEMRRVRSQISKSVATMRRNSDCSGLCVIARVESRSRMDVARGARGNQRNGNGAAQRHTIITSRQQSALDPICREQNLQFKSTIHITALICLLRPCTLR